MRLREIDSRMRYPNRMIRDLTGVDLEGQLSVSVLDGYP